MRRTSSRYSSLLVRGMLILSLLLMMSVFIGCSSSGDDGGTVEICNHDNEEYDVELRKSSNDEVVKEFDLGEFYDLADKCDRFEGIDGGRYYITIYEKDSNNSDSSNSFYVEDGEFRFFSIDSTGDIRGDNSDSDEGTIMICNHDNEEYEVELRRTSDGGFIEDFDLEEWYEAGDSCDEFKHVDEGEYYLTIYEKDSETVHESDNFYLDGDEFENFVIDDTGTIEKRN